MTSPLAIVKPAPAPGASIRAGIQRAEVLEVEQGAQPMRALGTIIGSLAIAAITTSVGCVDSESQDPDATNVGGKADDPEDWCHRGLSANDGVQMSVDYQVKDTSDANSFEMSATPVWL